MKREFTQYIVLSSSETEPTEDIGLSELKDRDTSKGFFDITYHYIIRRSGEIEYGRDYHDHAMGLGNKNPWCVSVCLVGGKGEPVITEAQVVTAKDVLGALLTEYPDASVIDRHEINKKAPPLELAKYFQEGTTGC